MTLRVVAPAGLEQDDRSRIRGAPGVARDASARVPWLAADRRGAGDERTHISDGALVDFAAGVEGAAAADVSGVTNSVDDPRAQDHSGDDCCYLSASHFGLRLVCTTL